MLECHIRHRMADKEISDIKELMALCNISRNSANKPFHTKDILTMKLGTLIKICNGLECTLNDLIEYDPKKEEKK